MAGVDGGVQQLSEPLTTGSVEGRTARSWVLASASPRRADLLRAAGFEIEIQVADVDETPVSGESAGETAQRLAEDKARAVAALRPQGTVIGGDTVVVLEADLLGKPVDADDARTMLSRLSGRVHQVITGAALCDAASGVLVSGRHVSDVEFAELSEAQREAYIAGGEWRGKAGAYAIQGDAAAFATLRAGHLDTVIGLSVTLVKELHSALCKALGSGPEDGSDATDTRAVTDMTEVTSMKDQPREQT